MGLPDAVFTPRLRLRRPESTDARVIYDRWASDPAATRYMAWPTHVTIDDSHAFLDFSRMQWDQHAMGPYLVQRIDTEEVIGSSGFAARDHRSAEIGYILARSEWGQGLATEIVRALVDVAVANELFELRAGVHPDNRASIRVLEKSGFTSRASVGMRFPNSGLRGDIEGPCYILRLSEAAGTEQAHEPGGPHEQP